MARQRIWVQLGIGLCADGPYVNGAPVECNEATIARLWEQVLLSHARLRSHLHLGDYPDRWIASGLPTIRPESFEMCCAPMESKSGLPHNYDCALYCELDVDYCKLDQIGSRLGFPHKRLRRRTFPARRWQG